MALNGVITAQQLTTFVLYVEFVTYASLNVCDQWGAIMESIGASERVMEFLDKPPAAQLAPGRVLPQFSGSVRPPPLLHQITAIDWDSTTAAVSQACCMLRPMAATLFPAHHAGTSSIYKREPIPLGSQDTER